MVKSLPDLREAPREWFLLADLQGNELLEVSELAAGLAAVLPLSSETIRTKLETGWPEISWPVSFEEFLQEHGPAHWAAQQLASLSSQEKNQLEPSNLRDN
eukprot:gb/GFBE01029928.1/.p1 GENE.gb/GFBE01029928.1/~~gb/GFBE01029928.1/.p1  ORF type:complete len:101 (+),score=16.81 gb/GFBE01029928.1/:1-303(+)